MASSPISSSNNLCEQFHSARQTFVELMGCADSETPVTEESLKKEFYVVMAAGIISCALLVIGLIGQLGLFPLGSSSGNLLTFMGGAGLLLTVYVGYRHWKKTQEYEKSELARLEQEARAAGASIAQQSMGFLSNRWQAITSYMPWSSAK